MKVYMIGSAKPDFANGGVEGSIANISWFLVKRGHEVINFCYNYIPYTEENEFGKVIALKKILNPTINKFVYGFRVAGHLKGLLKCGEAAVVHGHADNCFGYALRKTKTPFIWTVQGTSFGSYFKSNYRELEKTYASKNVFMKALFYFTERYMRKPILSVARALPEYMTARKADLIVTCSKSVKEELAGYYGISMGKIKVIYNGVNLNIFKPVNKKEARKKLGLDENKTYGIFVGVQSIRKGLDIAVDAIRKVGNAELLLVGPMPAYMKSENVRHIGGIHDQRILNDVYNAADFMLFPSRYEPFGIVMLEAMATGTPVIMNDRCGAAEVVRNGEDAIVVKGFAPEAYAKAARRIMADRKLYEKIAKNGIKIASQYAWEIQAGKYLSLYKMLTKNGG